MRRLERVSSDLRDLLQSSLGNSYRLERELGGGGMSRVFLADDKSLDRRVVVKLLPPELAAAISIERFRREIQLAARLQHSYIVPLLQAGEADGLPYYTMPLIDGESLRDRLAREGPLPIATAVQVISDVAEALAYAHEHGVVHRDIKPDNILLTSRHALVTDFGVAKALNLAAATAHATAPGTLTATGVVIGTPAYLAPEQAAADPQLDHRADLYALGVVAYEMLAGELPFHHRTPAEALRAHILEQPTRLASKRKGIPAWLDALIMQLLEKNPAARPQSANDVLSKLLPITSPTVSRRKSLLQVAAAVGVLAIAFSAIALSRRESGRSDGPKAVVVLPFSNVGGDTTVEYFADGMTDELTGALSEIPTLRVISRTSAFAFKDRHADIRDIARQLGANRVVEGVVQRSGDQLRVRVQLTRASDGTALWTQSYDRRLEDVFAVEDDITRSIVRGLQVTLTGDSMALLGHRGTDNLRAYDLYLRGQFYENKGDEPSVRRSLALYRQALAVDSNYAPAWVGIAEDYGWMSDEFLAPDASYPQSDSAARRAIALDPGDAAAHAVLANTLLAYDHNLKGAEDELRRAFAVQKNPGTAFVGAGMLFIATGRTDSAITILRNIEALDPLNPALKGWNAWMFSTLDRNDEAIDEAHRALELDPANPYAYLPLGDALRAKGQMQGAIEAYQKALALGNRARAALASTYAAVGRQAEARALLDSLRADASRRYVGADVIASVYASLGDNDEAFRWLDKALADRCGQLILAGFDHRWDPLRADPRFEVFMKKLGLTVWRHPTAIQRRAA